MIVVKIELWPFGSPLKREELGRMYIANRGDGSAKRGNYDVAVCRKGSRAVPQPIDPNGPVTTRVGAVFDYPRQAHNVWRLIARAVLSAFPEERGRR